MVSSPVPCSEHRVRDHMFDVVHLAAAFVAAQLSSAESRRAAADAEYQELTSKVRVSECDTRGL